MMQTVPTWLVPILLVVLTMFAATVAASFVGSQGRVLARLAIRYSKNRKEETVARALPVALLTAVLMGSLSVGDGLFAMVEDTVNDNLSEVDIVVQAPSFLPDTILEGGEDINFAPVIMVEGTAQGKSNIPVGVTVIAMDDRLLELGHMTTSGGQSVTGPPDRNSVLLNSVCSSRAGVPTGENVLIEATFSSRRDNILLSSGNDMSFTLNLTVDSIISHSGLGRYREDALDEVKPLVFMSLLRLQEITGRIGEANRFLIDADRGMDQDDIARMLEDSIIPEDIGFEILPADSIDGSVMISDQFLFDDDGFNELENGHPTLSYFVDSINSSRGSLSYSVITGSKNDLPGTMNGPQPGEIVINNWTAEAMDLSKGDTVSLDYRYLTDHGTLRNANRDLAVSSIVSMDGIYMEDALMPPIEGITSSISCSDWDPSFDIDLDSLEEEDLLYWELYGTTPKGFISLQDAREMWSVPWGDTTGLVFSTDVNSTEDSVTDGTGLEISEISVIPVRENAFSSSRSLSIFPGMFLTFGMAVIISTSLILAAVVGDVTLRMKRDWGTLRSIGTDRLGLFRFGMMENLPSVILGGFLGILIGLLISFLLGLALDGVWSGTVESAEVPFTVHPFSVLVSVVSGMIVSVMVSGYVLLRSSRDVPASNLRDTERQTSWKSGVFLFVPGLLVLIVGLLIISLTEGYVEGTFGLAGPFVLGSLMITMGVGLSMISLTSHVIVVDDRSLIVTADLARRPGRTRTGIIFLSLVLSLAISLSGFGSLLDSAMQDDLDSYGGGYDLLIETEIDLEDSGKGTDVEGYRIVPVLTYGDEGGTCSNINAVYPPRLIGLPDMLIQEGGFELKEVNKEETGYRGLGSLHARTDDRIPIVVDENTLKWIYYGDIGTIFEIRPSPGISVEMEVVGILEPSVLTGTFVMSEENLKSIYPTPSGYDMFLVRGGASDEDIGRMEKHFGEMAPEVRSTTELAEENLRFEMGYLMLFRDFLMFGVFTSLVAMIIFHHSRATRFIREMALFRSIGVTSNRARSYLIMENLYVALLSVIISTIGSVIALSVAWTSYGGSVDISGLALGILPVIAMITGISCVSSVVSGYWSARGYHELKPATGS